MNHFWGRRLLTRDIKAIDCEEVNLPNYEKIAAVERLGNWILCHRCGMRTSVIDGQLADYGYFCTHCSYLGRCDTQQDLYLFDQPEAKPREVVFFGQDSLLKNKRKSQREYFAIQKKTSSYLGCNRCRENRDALSYFSGNFKSWRKSSDLYTASRCL